MEAQDSMVDQIKAAPGTATVILAWNMVNR